MIDRRGQAKQIKGINSRGIVAYKHLLVSLSPCSGGLGSNLYFAKKRDIPHLKVSPPPKLPDLGTCSHRLPSALRPDDSFRVKACDETVLPKHHYAQLQSNLASPGI
jgi:hypothetical protein